MSTKAAPKATWSLSKIELISGSTTKLYANGRQQVKIIVRLECTTATQVISDPELQTLRLIEYRGSEPLRPPGGTGSWFSSPIPNDDYDYYPDNQSETSVAILDTARNAGGARPDANGIYYRDFYITTTARDSLRIAVEIVRAEDEYTYRSNGEGDNGSSPAAHVDIFPIPSPTFKIDNYVWERVRVEGPDTDNAYDTIDNWYLAAQYEGRIVDIRELSAIPISMIKWQDPVTGNTFASYTGYAGPGKDAATFTEGITGGSSHRPDTRVRQPRAGRGVVILVRRGDVPFYSNSEHGPCAVSAIDAYGNGHRLSVRFEGGTNRNRLEIQMG